MENFASLEQVRAPRFHFIGLPLKIRGLTALPIRAVAIEELARWRTKRRCGTPSR
jgi:kynurenine formamidase